MGADQVINHSHSLVEQLKDLEIQPAYVAALNATDQHLPDIFDLTKARGRIAVIDDPKTLDINPGKPKSLSFCWEFMFARPMFETEDIDKQHQLLNQVSEMIDSKKLTSTVNSNLAKLTPENLKKAHQLQETGKVIGKIVLEGLS